MQYVWQEVRNSFDERRTVLEQIARAVRLRGLSTDAAEWRATEVCERITRLSATGREDRSEPRHLACQSMSRPRECVPARA
ncbi:hypothetical protein [Streptomyces sp. Rer75]|uniref:hypothetical protein n=1 Tax=Streptomyces sp. Rer75 TaxID=2750011 RepID=UPI0015D0CACE|nr:hypothetical protein [Streptomyces sp. Rer75]QLH25340.1 hypothetical protein HYQ63_35865 [Streptomyces sp. Rer75]